MWLLQRKLSLSKRQRYLLELIAVSAGMHLLVMLTFCFTGRKKERLVLSLASEQAPIVIMPFIKSVGLEVLPQAPAPLKPQVVSAAKTQLIAAQASKKKVVPPAKPPVAQQPAAQAKPEKKGPEPEKVAEHKQEASKAAEPVQQKPIQKKDEPAAVAQQGATASQAVQPVHIGREDAQLLSLVQDMRRELEEGWHRPSGLPEEMNYEITVEIDQKGMVRILKEKSSGALALDIAARSFIVSYNFPKKVWGREIECIL